MEEAGGSGSASDAASHLHIHKGTRWTPYGPGWSSSNGHSSPNMSPGRPALTTTHQQVGDTALSPPIAIIGSIKFK